MRKSFYTMLGGVVLGILGVVAFVWIGLQVNASFNKVETDVVSTEAAVSEIMIDQPAEVSDGFASSDTNSSMDAVPKSALNEGLMTMTIMVPSDYQEYRKRMTAYVQEGGDDPLKTLAFVGKELPVPEGEELIYASANAAAAEIPPSGGPQKAVVTYLEVHGSTVYVVLNIDQEGWAGSSISTAIIHPLVEKSLLQITGIKTVVFGEAPIKNK